MVGVRVIVAVKVIVGVRVSVGVSVGVKVCDGVTEAVAVGMDAIIADVVAPKPEAV